MYTIYLHMWQYRQCMCMYTMHLHMWQYRLYVFMYTIYIYIYIYIYTYIHIYIWQCGMCMCMYTIYLNMWQYRLYVYVHNIYIYIYIYMTMWYLYVYLHNIYICDNMVCVCVCIHILFVYTYEYCVCVYIRILCVCIYIRILCVCVYVHILCVCVYIHIPCVCAYINILCVYIYIRILCCLYAYIHINTHTNTYIFKHHKLCLFFWRIMSIVLNACKRNAVGSRSNGLKRRLKRALAESQYIFLYLWLKTCSSSCLLVCAYSDHVTSCGKCIWKFDGQSTIQLCVWESQANPCLSWILAWMCHFLG
jgi:hypothetical protein